MRRTRNCVFGAALVALALGATACGSGGGTTIVVGSTNFTEQEILGEIYAQALEAEGFPIERRFQLGSREVVEPAIESGEIGLYAEYLATVLTFLSKPDQPSADLGDVEAAHAELGARFADRGVTVLDYAPAVDANAIVVTRATADRLGLVTTSEALRLAFFVVLLLGIAAESRSDLRALRSAYAALDRLRLSEAERATLEERTRLARELHDGLAQDLWFAKLKHERLVPFVPDEQRPLAAEVTEALDSAIVEAKQAVVTMRAEDDRDVSLEGLLARTVNDFAGRSGVRADFSAADLPQSLTPRTQVEVLRVLQEALTNVRKHADATVVRVNAEVGDGQLQLSVIDNGRGFRPTETIGDGVGMQSMKERARLMGGELRVVSEPSAGTALHLTVPLGEAAVTR